MPSTAVIYYDWTGQFEVQEWRVDGRLHRNDGPAVQWADGMLEWRQNGKQHRLDGPAIMFADGSAMWWIDDHLVDVEPPDDSELAWFA
jgi:hypothetical protein